MAFPLLFLILLLGLVAHVECELSGYSAGSDNRITGDDEPHMVSWRVLQGIIEPFEESKKSEIPPWKLMKEAADHKAANLAIQQALSSYSQLLRHRDMFGDMPIEERYDVFVSIAKLLKRMGFHQRAELLLYEAMSYTTNPYEAHFQLGLLALDKEDMHEAKQHLKNCLFYREGDVLILTHLAVVLIGEGRIYEAKFFVSRLLSALEIRTQKLLSLLGHQEFPKNLTSPVDQSSLVRWLEDLIVRCLHGELRVTPSGTFDMIRMFSNLYTLLSESPHGQSSKQGPLAGRFMFDLGMSLYEGGKPAIGLHMMKLGQKSADLFAEGEISIAVINMRLGLENPLVPSSLGDVVEGYLNVSAYLESAPTLLREGEKIDIENSLDLYWPVPVLGWSGLPHNSMVSQLLERFSNIPVRSDSFGLYFLNYEKRLNLEKLEKRMIYMSMKAKATESASTDISALDSSTSEFDSISDLYFDDDDDDLLDSGKSDIILDTTSNVISSKFMEKSRKDLGEDFASNLIEVVNGDGERHTLRTKKRRRKKESKVIPPIEVGILGGHMNSHPVGQMVLSRILGFLGGRTYGPGVGSRSGHSGPLNSKAYRLTLLALPLVPDMITRKIAGGLSAGNIVNLPLDKELAWQVIESLRLDIILIPDWQPFPDQQGLLLASARMAPIQACFFVRGTGCSFSKSENIDYYLLPAEVEAAYDSEWKSGRMTANRAMVGHSSNENSNEKYAGPQRIFIEDWPLLTPQVILRAAEIINTTSASRQTFRNGGGQGGERSREPELGPLHSGAGFSLSNDRISSSKYNNQYNFVPSEIEGQVIFEDQPVAILPIHPSQVHPLMDTVLFKILQACPSLHLVLVVPEGYFNYASTAPQPDSDTYGKTKNSKGQIKTDGNEKVHKLAWARKLVRRLWARGGSLYHRIRLLPSPLSDKRMIQLFRQADMVLDTFPIGISSHYLSLSLGAGTPVITMRSGVLLNTPESELRMLRQKLVRAAHLRQNFTDEYNLKIIEKQLAYILNNDVPWQPTISTVAGFYKRSNPILGLENALVANDTAHYFRIAAEIALNREEGYRLRVNLLEAVDETPGVGFSLSNMDAGYSTNGGGCGIHDAACTAGLWDFVGRIGGPWALRREQFLQKEKENKPRPPKNNDMRNNDENSVESSTRKRDANIGIRRRGQRFHDNDDDGEGHGPIE